jgi:hypothetical protein
MADKYIWGSFTQVTNQSSGPNGYVVTIGCDNLAVGLLGTTSVDLAIEFGT